MLYRFIIILITIGSLHINASAQLQNLLKKSDDAENLSKAEAYLQEGKFEKALLLYKKMYNKNKNSPKINFLLGYAYLNIGYGHEKALQYLLKSIELKTNNANDKAPLERYYYTALGYYQNKQYTKAINYLDTLLTKISVKDKLFKTQTQHLKENCQNAAMFAQSNINLDEANLYELNSKYSDKNPLIFNNGTEIIFTSARETLRRGKSKQTKTTDDNIYYSIKENGMWSNPMYISNINTEKDETACWIAQDGSFMIIKQFDNNQANIFFTERNENNEWSKPVKFNAPINSSNNETYGSLSHDGKYLLFTSDRKGGYGGLDIYVSERLGKNKWSEPKNLGNIINTKYNEESPLMHENGVLFFCTRGHVSMGGFDIFTSSKDENGKWKTPTNMGAPINTINDDFFFQVMPHGQYAYTSSGRKGTKGFSDIFKYYVNDSSQTGYALVSGKINCTNKIDFSKELQLKIDNCNKTNSTKIYKTNKHGYFSIIIPADAEYNMSYMYKGKVFYKAKLLIPKSYAFLANDESIRIKNVNLLINKLTNIDTTKIDIYKSDEKTTETIKKGKSIIEQERLKKKNILVADNNNKDTEKKSALVKRYSIKLSSSEKPQDLATFKNVENVSEHIDSTGNYIYYIGSYEYEWEALIKLKLIKEDYPNASIFVNNFM